MPVAHSINLSRGESDKLRKYPPITFKNVASHKCPRKALIFYSLAFSNFGVKSLEFPREKVLQPSAQIITQLVLFRYFTLL